MVAKMHQYWKNHLSGSLHDSMQLFYNLHKAVIPAHSWVYHLMNQWRSRFDVWQWQWNYYSRCCYVLLHSSLLLLHGRRIMNNYCRAKNTGWWQSLDIQFSVWSLFNLLFLALFFQFYPPGIDRCWYYCCVVAIAGAFKTCLRHCLLLFFAVESICCETKIILLKKLPLCTIYIIYYF